MATEKKRTRTVQAIPPEQFNTFIEGMKTSVDQLVDAAYRLGQAGGERLGGIYGKKELNANKSEYKKALTQVEKQYAAVHKLIRKPRAPGAARGGQGFQNPVQISPALRQFIQQGNFGNGPDGRRLQDSLPSLSSGVTTSALLTPLFSIYVHQNGLQNRAASNQAVGNIPALMNNQYLGADDLMKQVFDPDLRYLSAVNAAPHKTKRGQVIPPFSPDNFRFASWQSIVALNRMLSRASADKLIAAAQDEDRKAGRQPRPADQIVDPAKILTPQQEALLQNPATKQSLAQEFAVVRQVNEAFKARNKDVTKQAKSERRKLQAKAKKAGLKLDEWIALPQVQNVLRGGGGIQQLLA
jgi:hypothetical protein